MGHKVPPRPAVQVLVRHQNRHLTHICERRELCVDPRPGAIVPTLNERSDDAESQPRRRVLGRGDRLKPLQAVKQRRVTHSSIIESAFYGIRVISHLPHGSLPAQYTLFQPALGWKDTLDPPPASTYSRTARPVHCIRSAPPTHDAMEPLGSSSGAVVDSLQSALFHHRVVRRDPPGKRVARPTRTAPPLLVGDTEVHAHTEV